MKSIFRLLPSLCYLLFFSSVQAQKTPGFNCGFDGLRVPAEEKSIHRFEEALQVHLSQKRAADFMENLPYVLPVVVHIIHNGGSENISDAQVLAAVDHLNMGFSAQGYFSQQGANVNTQIQFCLARRDPDDLSTTGITRTQSPLTNMIQEIHDIQVKDLNRWDPLKYINIWVVREITSLAAGPSVSGYAFFPNAHGSPQDGMICEAATFGIDPGSDAVLIHEMGHYFGLYHTFEGGCANNDCSIDGDKICDTPPDNAIHTACPFNSCSTDVMPGSPFLTDVDDYTGDFMDYSPFSCYQYFTADQAIRMQETIASVRKSLLDSKGCYAPCSQAVMADFSAVPNPVIAGGTVTFTSTSANASQFSWSENYLEFAQGPNASRTFTTDGFHTIVLTATTNDPNCWEIAIAIHSIFVQCPVQVGFTPDQLEALEGTTVHFTNTSSGDPSLTYEWSVNGQLVSSGTDLDFLFSIAGSYTVSLKSVGTYCERDTSIVIKIANACGQFPEPNTIAYTAAQKLFQPRDIVTLPDGSIIQCGEHFQHPMITKWDQAGNLLWNRETPDDGTITQIALSPDGNVLISGEANSSIFIAKMNANGNLLWSRTFPSIGQVGFQNHRQFEVIAVNPDDSFGFLFRDDSVDGAYLSKFAPDGNLLWSRKILKVGQAGSLNIATDGSGDFVFASHISGNVSSEGFTLISISQSGTLTAVRRHRLPGAPLIWIQNFDLSLHDDGGYSIFYTEGNFSLSQDLRKYLIRYNADGSTRWGNRYNLSNTDQRRASYLRKLPNEKGWLMIDSRREANLTPLGDLLERIDSNGQILWARYLGDTPANDTWVMPPAYESGRIRSVHCDFFNFDIHVLNIIDRDTSMICAPIVPALEEIVPVSPNLSTPTIFAIQKNLTVIDLPLLFDNVALTSKEVCSTLIPCPEICDNEIDDDLDGLIDCLDTDCNCSDLSTPDAIVQLDSTFCQTDSIGVFLTICNQGNGTLPGGFPIQFYLGDPTNSPAPILFPAILIPETLEKGACTSILLKIPATYNAPIYAVVNDNGSFPRPYSLLTNFPVTTQTELHYDNNLVSFFIPYQTPTLNLGPDIALCKNSVVQLFANPAFQTFRWQDGSDQPNFTAYSAGTYWVDAVDMCGFKQSDSVHIALNLSATLDLPEKHSICPGASVQLGATGFDQYTWSPSDMVSCTSCDTIQVSPMESITILLTAANGACFVSDTVRIEVNPKPVSNLLIQQDICHTLGSIEAQVAGEGPFAFSWSNTSKDSIINPLYSGTYTVTITDQNGCKTSDSVDISFSNPIQISASAYSPLCANTLSGKIDVTVTGGLAPMDYLWSNNGSIEDLNQVGAGAYTVTVTDGYDCTATFSVLLTDPPELILSLQSSGLVCPGDSGLIDLNVAGGSGNLIYHWSTGDTAQDLTIVQSGIYAVTVADANGCSVSHEMVVAAADSLIAMISTDSVHCFGENNGAIHVISNVGGTPPLEYSIDNQLFQEDSSFTNLAAGLYHLYIQDANKCLFQTEVIVAQPNPLSVELIGDSLIEAGAFALVQAMVSPPDWVPTEINWNAEGVLLLDQQLMQQVSLSKNTLFHILIADNKGCMATDSLLVLIHENLHKTYVPNIFKPGDSGNPNEIFTIYSDHTVQEIESLDIFDRWGSQVFSKQHFQANDSTVGWDGTFRGKPVAPGVYIWVAKIVFKEKQMEIMAGNVTVLR